MLTPKIKIVASFLVLTLIFSAVLPHYANAEEPTGESTEFEDELEEFISLLDEIAEANIDLINFSNTREQIDELSNEAQNTYYAFKEIGTIDTLVEALEPVPTKEEMENQIQPQVWGSITKKVVEKALRYGGTYAGDLIKKIPYKWADKVGDSISKYGNKAADVLNELTNFTENAVALGLVKAGIPPADALLIAKFIVFFLA